MNDPLPCARLRPIILAVAAACILTFLVGPIVAAVVAVVFAPVGIAVPAALGAVAFAAVMGYLMSSSYQWVEVDGGTIRGRRLLTRKVVEMRVADITEAKPIHTNYLGALENALLDFLLDTSNRGFQLFFRDGSRLPLIRADMSGVDEFLGAVAEQLRAIREAAGEPPLTPG